jgi:tetratricopeptide (TPR) repeat protein
MQAEEQGVHLEALELFRFLQGTLGRSKRKAVELHLDGCAACVEALAMVLRAERPGEAEEEAALAKISGGDPKRAFDRLRAEIISSGPARGGRTGAEWRNLLRAVAALAAVGALAWGGHHVFVAPTRARSLAEGAIADLVRLRQGAGRFPLRYIQGFDRALVTRSSFESGDPAEEAIQQSLHRALDLGPHEPRAHLALGLFLLDRGELTEAEQELEAALQGDPLLIEAANGLAVALYARAHAGPEREELLRRGLLLLRRAQEQAPRDLQVNFNLGVFYHALGEAQFAERAWKYYLRLDAASEWAAIAREHIATPQPPG